MRKNTSYSLRWLVTGLLAIFFVFIIAYAFRQCSQGHSAIAVDRLSPQAPELNFTLPDSFSGLPFFNKTDHIIRHTGYVVNYNELHREANWVAYRLTLTHVNGRIKRKDNFREDELTGTFRATLEDYRHSGYDRGHLAPAADMKWSEEAMSESFLLSNICPQDHGFNCGIWNDLEEDIRHWAKRDNSLWIVTGPVLKEGLAAIGHDKVSVPEYFYKVVLDAEAPELKAAAFIIPNKNLKCSYWNYCVPVDSAEKITGLDFFHELPDSVEDVLEKEMNPALWP